MFFLSPLRRAVAAFFLLVVFAVLASAVCVAFGAHTMPSVAAGPQAEASLRGKPAAAAMEVADAASRARAGT